MANTVVTCQQLNASRMRIIQLQILPSKGTELEIAGKFIICIIACYQYLLFSCHILCKFVHPTRGILVPWDCSVKWSWGAPWSSPALGKASEFPAHQWLRCASSGRVLQQMSVTSTHQWIPIQISHLQTEWCYTYVYSAEIYMLDLIMWSKASEWFVFP